MERLVTGILAVYAITLLMNQYDGPGGAFYKLREVPKLKVITCFACLSVLVSGLISLLLVDGFSNWVLLTPALAGGAIILHRITTEYL